MVHDAGQIGIRERYATEWRSPQNFARCGFSILAEEKAGLRIQVGVSPAVQNDSFNVPPRIKPDAAEHLSELLADFSLVIPERRGQHFSAAAVSLIGGR